MTEELQTAGPDELKPVEPEKTNAPSPLITFAKWSGITIGVLT